MLLLVFYGCAISENNYVIRRKNFVAFYLCLLILGGHCADCDVNFTASDYYQFDDLLTPEEQAIRMKVRECMEKEVAPVMTKVLPLFSVFV